MTSPFLDPRLSDVFANSFAPTVQAAWPDYTHFTPWLSLGRRKHPIRSGPTQVDEIGSFQGVYLVALFADGAAIPDGPADPFDGAVTYIGRTRTALMANRWRQFVRSAGGGAGHSGGVTFYKQRVRDSSSSTEAVLGRTRIAGLPVWVGTDGKFDPRRTSFRTALLEAALVEAVQTHQVDHGLSGLLNKA